VLDETDGSVDDHPRAAVVHFEVHAAEAGQRVRETEDATNIREAPAVDRLVVVADEEDPVRRCREHECHR
jgi:hypothetical protein